jgi:predicted RND superfamily exporter protein
MKGISLFRHLSLSKKGQTAGTFGALMSFGIGMVIAAILFAVGLQVLGSTRDSLTANSAEKNATIDAITGVSNVTAKFPLIGTVVAAVIIIGLVVTGLGVYFRNR